MDKIPKINAFLKIPNAWTAEIAGSLDFDYVTIDMQHGLMDYATMLSMLQSLKGSASKILVRAPWNEPSALMRILDAGAHGIICPMINRGEEALSFVRSCQYPPEGDRSFGPIRATLVGSYSGLQRTNNTILTFAMIETKTALENLEAIAATENLHGLYIGPADLSISLGLPTIADFNDHTLLEALKKVRKIASKHQLSTAIQAYGLSDIRVAKELGFDIITPINDSALYKFALQQKLDLVKNEFKGQ